MMSPATTGKPSGKDEAQITSTTRKPSSSATRPQEPPIKCPRCDSPNTKFCYYNNYSLTQPRHFCKTCRRYWTKGGALRNVPIGGGCRKNKKMKSSPRLPGDSKDSGGSSSDIGGLKFFQGLSPAMDFQLNNIPRQLHTSNTTAGFFNQFSSYGDTSSPANFNLEGSGISTPLLGFTFPLSSATLKQGDNSNTTTIPLGFQEMGNLASSIESLSSINQDLHWRLQQQRLANLFVNDKEENSMNIPSELQLIQKPQPILFHHLDNNSKTQSFLGGSSRKDAGLSTAELFFDHSYEAEPAQATGGSNNLNDNATNWSGISQTWTELSNFTSLP